MLMEPQTQMGSAELLPRFSDVLQQQHFQMCETNFTAAVWLQRGFSCQKLTGPALAFKLPAFQLFSQL